MHFEEFGFHFEFIYMCSKQNRFKLFKDQTTKSQFAKKLSLHMQYVLLLDSAHCNRVLLSTPNIGGKMTPNDDEVFPQIGAPAFCPHFN